MASYEGKWRCGYCSAINLGRDMGCLGCARRRGEDVEFFLDEDQVPLVDAERITEARIGPDWTCDHCESNNRGNIEVCATCSNPKTVADAVLVPEEMISYGEQARKKRINSDSVTRSEEDDTGYGKTDDETDDGYMFGGGEGKEGSGKKSGYKNASSAAPSDTGPWSRGRESETGPRLFFGFPLKAVIIISSITAVVLFVIGMVIYLDGLRYNIDLDVDKVEWKRVIHVQNYETRSGDGWRDELPAGAFNTSCSMKKRGTREVPDGTERVVCGKIDKKNGYFEDKYCNVPKKKTVDVNDSYCTYSVKEWVSGTPRTESGYDYKPVWPSFTPGYNQREAGRSEYYIVYFKQTGASGLPYSKSLTESTFRNYKAGEHYMAKINYFGEIKEIEGPVGNW